MINLVAQNSTHPSLHGLSGSGIPALLSGALCSGSYRLQLEVSRAGVSSEAQLGKDPLPGHVQLVLGKTHLRLVDRGSLWFFISASL